MEFLTNLLTGEGAQAGGDWMTFIIIGIMVVALVVMFITNSRSNKKRQQEQEATMKALRPGNKVKTIGGVCGIVVEVNQEESTFVLETGNEANGKSYVKFDMQAIYQTDAKPEEVKPDAKADEAKPEEDKKEEESKTE